MKRIAYQMLQETVCDTKFHVQQLYNMLVNINMLKDGCFYEILNYILPFANKNSLFQILEL